MPEKILEPISLDTPFAKVKNNLSRQLYKTPDGKFDAIDNEQFHHLLGSIKGEVICACDGSLKQVTECLTATNAIPHTFDINPEMGSPFGIIIDLNSKFADLIKVKHECAKEGLRNLCSYESENKEEN